MNIGERQTVQRAKHPTLGEGRLVSDNGPCFFLADSGEVEHYRNACHDTAWKSGGGAVKFDVKGYPGAKSHCRVVRVPENQAGWLVMWFDEFRTWCHEFQPDNGDPFKFAVTQAWIGGPQDNGGNTPKKREHLWTRKGRDIVFTYYKEADKAKAEAADKMPDAPQRGTRKATPAQSQARVVRQRGPMPGPNATRAEIDAWLRSA